MQAQAKRQETGLRFIACMIYLHVPTVFASEVAKHFPLDDGDHLHYRRPMETGMTIFQFYVAHWHWREAQVLYLQTLREKCDKAGIEGLRMTTGMLDGYRYV